MKDFNQKVADYLASKGINPFWFIIALGVVGLLLEAKNIRNWKSLAPNQKQFHRPLITGYILCVLVGLIYVIGILKYS